MVIHCLKIEIKIENKNKYTYTLNIPSNKKMHSVLGIGCIIDIDDNNNINNIKYCLRKNKILPLDIYYEDNEYIKDNIVEIMYDFVNKFLKKQNLPFYFYTPYIEGCNFNKMNYYMVYQENGLTYSDSFDEMWESIEFDTLVNKYTEIKEQFEKTIRLLFGDDNVDKYKLEIFSTFTD